MATVYSELGVKITVVELMDQLIPGADKDIVTPLDKTHHAALRKHPPEDQGDRDRGQRRRAARAGSRAARRPSRQHSTRCWSQSGDDPAARLIGAENAGVLIDERGYIQVDKQQRTNVPHIFAIGDIVGQPMLAHKAIHEGKVAAEVAAGLQSYFDAKRDPIGGLHRPRSGLGRRHRNRGKDRWTSSTARGCFRGWRAAGR